MQMETSVKPFAYNVIFVKHKKCTDSANKMGQLNHK